MFTLARMMTKPLTVPEINKEQLVPKIKRTLCKYKKCNFEACQRSCAVYLQDGVHWFFKTAVTIL